MEQILPAESLLGDGRYRYIAEKFGFDAIKDRFISWAEEINAWLVRANFHEKAFISRELLGQAVLDYFADIDRTKDFHGLEHANEIKIYSYGAFWLLRRKPIQLVTDDVPLEVLSINEKAVASILVAKMLEECEAVYAGKINNEEGLFTAFQEMLIYNFAYRPYTSQTLELMVEAFFCGVVCFSTKREGRFEWHKNRITDVN